MTPYSFYKEKLDDMSSKLTVETVFSTILESDVRIKVEVDRTLLPKQEASSQNNSQDQEQPGKTPEQSSLLDSAMEIMGGKIVE